MSFSMRGRFGALLGLGERARTPDRAAMTEIKSWAREALALAEDASIVVNEIVCTDPGCPGVETVMLIMEPGRKTRAVKIPLSLDAVTEQDVRAAVLA
jgi:hypothetical protein